MDKLAALADLYRYVLANTESFEEENIGADLAYLMGAVLTDVPAAWPDDRPLLQLLTAGRRQPAIAYALQYVRTEAELAPVHPERCDCKKCRPELYV